MVILFSLLGDPTPRFEPRDMPVNHVYLGGWEHFVGGGVAVFDCDDNGLPDMAAAGGEAPMRLFRNITGPDSRIAFEEVPVTQITGVTGAYPLDIDSDGIRDLVVLRVGPNEILRGLGNCRFERAAWHIPKGDAWTTAFSATWEAGRDWPTLAFGNYVDRSDPDGPFEACDDNILLRHDGSDYTEQPLTPGFCALSMLFSDWNGSGIADLRVSNDRHYYVRGGSEQMWRMPDLTLRDGDGWEPVSIWGMGIASRDLNGDGRPEVMLTSMGDQLLQFAVPDGYENARFEIGAAAQRPHVGDDGRPSTGWHAQFGDADNDGLSDLFIAKGNVDQMPGMAMRDPNNLLMGTRNGRFVERSVEAGTASTARSRGAQLADFNRDGLLDLVVVNRRAPLELYQNVTATAGHWVGVDLTQEGANRDAIGAKVQVRTRNGVQQQEVTLGGGHVSGQIGPLHFGLGAVQGAQLRVIWPDGAMSDWQTLEIDAYQRITR